MPRAHSDSVYSGSERRQFNSPRLVKREAGFPNPRRALIGSNLPWRVDDSPYYREFLTNMITPHDHMAQLWLYLCMSRSVAAMSDVY